MTNIFRVSAILPLFFLTNNQFIFWLIDIYSYPTRNSNVNVFLVKGYNTEVKSATRLITGHWKYYFCGSWISIVLFSINDIVDIDDIYVRNKLHYPDLLWFQDKSCQFGRSQVPLYKKNHQSTTFLLRFSLFSLGFQLFLFASYLVRKAGNW